MPVLAGGVLVERYVLPVSNQSAPNGAWPQWELTLDPASSLMYGVAPTWGALKGGTLYTVGAGGAFNKLREFGGAGDVGGSKPSGPLLRANGVFYGVAELGGANAKGVLYKWMPATGYQVMYHFGSGLNGANPSGPLLQATDGKIYGATKNGGDCNQGVVFSMTPSTGVVAVLHSFCGQEGATPLGGVIQANDGALYGTTYVGGSTNGGTLFRLTLGGVFTQLASLGGSTTDPKYPSRLVQGKDGLLYGTSYAGGDSAAGKGVLFSSTLNGNVTVRYRFVDAPNLMSNPSVNAALLERFNGIFYGVTSGQNGGNVFQFRASNNSVTNIASFTTYGRIMWPVAGLTVGSDGNLWGSTTDGENLYLQRAGTFYVIQSLVANP